MSTGDRPIVAVTGRPLRGGRVTRWPERALAIQDTYLSAVERAGASSALLRPEPLDERAARRLLSRFDALVLTGGPDVDPACYGEDPHPSVYGTDAGVDRFEIALTLAAIDGGVPVLAICRGIQVLNVALGGSLDQHISGRDGIGDRHGVPAVDDGASVHQVKVAEGSLLAEVMGTTSPACSCHHHQALARLGEGLRVTAEAVDGVVEGVEVDGGWVLAVQWHPEDTAPVDPAQQRLFDALAARARR